MIDEGGRARVTTDEERVLRLLLPLLTLLLLLLLLLLLIENVHNDLVSSIKISAVLDQPNT